MWEIYAIAIVFGIVDAFFQPARASILPKIVADNQLEPGNAVLNVTSQLAIILGPVLGGVIVAALGIGWAFAADAACFAIGVLFVLWLPAAVKSGNLAHPDGGLAGQISAGFRYAWADAGIRASLVVIGVLDFAANGALGVGLPTLAHGRFGAGATGLGILFAAWGVGATAGALAAGFVHAPKRYGWLLVAVSAWIGVGIGTVGVVPSIVPAAVAMGLSGIATGGGNTWLITWLQRRSDPAMQGRIMSLVMLASVGLTPIAYAASGAIADVNPTLLFLMAGGMMVACAVGAAASRSVRSLR
jgi:hypothetical protein